MALKIFQCKKDETIPSKFIFVTKQAIAHEHKARQVKLSQAAPHRLGHTLCSLKHWVKLVHFLADEVSVHVNSVVGGFYSVFKVQMFKLDLVHSHNVSQAITFITKDTANV